MVISSFRHIIDWRKWNGFTRSRLQCDQMLELKVVKNIQKLHKIDHSIFYFRSDVLLKKGCFQNCPKFTKSLGYFRHQELSEIAQTEFVRSNQME